MDQAMLYPKGDLMLEHNDNLAKEWGGGGQIEVTDPHFSIP